MSRLTVKDRAEKARKRPAPVGPDINLDVYSDRAKNKRSIADLGRLAHEVKKQALKVGVDPEERCRSGSFFQIDHSVLLATAREEGLEVLSTAEALARYDWLRDYYWKAVNVDADKYTAQAELKQNQGYFLRSLPDAKVEFPLQACLYLSQEGLAQNVHNIIIAEEGSELHIITGCATASEVRTGLHIGVSEFYVKDNATISFTMIHNWAEDVSVRPRSAAVVGKNGIFLSNYICLKPVRTLQMYPTVYCEGENATARFNTILFAGDGAHIDVGARVYLSRRGSRAEIMTRALSRGGTIIARGHLVGEVPDIKAHLECRGLILSEGGTIHAIPELEGRVSGIDMSHEAAVGKIAEEEIQYLMARGLTEDEATAAIVRGFLDVEIKGLPDHLKGEIRRAVRIGEKRKRLF